MRRLWEPLVERMRRHEGQDLVTRAFRWGKSVPYRDTDTMRDDWRPPLAFMTSGGDCDDYAVAWMFLMKEIGIPAQDRAILLVWVRSMNSAHAVMAVRIGGEVWVLDNAAWAPYRYAELPKDYLHFETATDGFVMANRAAARQGGHLQAGPMARGIPIASVVQSIPESW
jgi:hypothetical protein